MTTGSGTGSRHGRRVLVVEDAFLTAESLALMLADLGYVVAGPVAKLSDAQRLIEAEHVDAALLDVNLRGELVTPVADRLLELGRPFLFLTAYGTLDVLPFAYRDYPRLLKPCRAEALAEALGALFSEQHPVDEAS